MYSARFLVSFPVKRSDFMPLRFISMAAFLVTSTTAATVSSVSGGGDWSDTLTWVGHAIPGENDDVINLIILQ
jgi:hypothetical protein